MQSPSHPHSELAQRLEAADYHEILLPGMPVADSLWADGAQADALAALAQDKGQSLRVRFFALEIYRIRRAKLPEGCTVADAIPLYVFALKHTPWEDDGLGISGNDWGFLAYLDQQGHDGANGLGKRTLELGAEMIPHLRPFLTDSRSVQYEGSRDATTGNMLAYQVKDVAAYLILRLQGQPLVYLQDRAARDKEIKALIAKLED